jgi:hypothetical protein
MKAARVYVSLSSRRDLLIYLEGLTNDHLADVSLESKLEAHGANPVITMFDLREPGRVTEPKVSPDMPGFWKHISSAQQSRVQALFDATGKKADEDRLVQGVFMYNHYLSMSVVSKMRCSPTQPSSQRYQVESSIFWIG